MTVENIPITISRGQENHVASESFLDFRSVMDPYDERAKSLLTFMQYTSVCPVLRVSMRSKLQRRL